MDISRRRVIQGLGAGAALGATPAWAAGQSVHHGSGAAIRTGFDMVSGEVIDLTVGAGQRLIEGRRGHAVAVNGSVPGPLIRLREGQQLRLNVTNHLAEDTSIHWHGLLLPFQFDGVPGVSFPGIKPGETFVYEFPIRQSGTYWYHSHSGLQEQMGHYGPLIIDPAGAEPVQADRDYILLLSEFTAKHPHEIMRKLRTGEHYFNRQLPNWSDKYPMGVNNKHGKNSMIALYGPESWWLEAKFPQWSAPTYEGRGSSRKLVKPSEIVGFDQAEAKRASSAKAGPG